MTTSTSISPVPAPPTGAVLADAKNLLPLDDQRVFSTDLPEVISGPNPLVAAANPILNLVPQIRNLPQVTDQDKFRDHLIEKIKSFEKEAQRRGLAADVIIGTRYCLCTLLDETSAKTPWGGFGEWSKRNLLVTFHNETWGGEKFFQLLSKLAQNPQQHRDLLVLMYYCLCLGFEGRFGILDNGKAQLETLRQRLWHILRDSAPAQPDMLSPHWQGEINLGTHNWSLLPAWVVACIALLSGILIYICFTFALASQSDKAFAQIAGIRMTKIALPKAMPPKKEAGLEKFLEPEVREGLVAVRDEADRSIITLRGDGLFASGSATVLDRYLPALHRVAQALSTTKGNIVVSGYTDNVPIRTVQYPSNFQLSQDRANHVAAILEREVADPSRIRAQGLGEADPIVPNNSTENRARNRRIEIVLLAAPTPPSGQ